MLSVLDLQAAAILLLLLLCPATPTPTPGNGSGIVWDSAGHIVTNYHVLQSALAKFGASPNAPLSSSAPNPAVGKKVALVTIEVKGGKGGGGPWVREGERGQGRQGSLLRGGGGTLGEGREREGKGCRGEPLPRFPDGCRWLRSEHHQLECQPQPGKAEPLCTLAAVRGCSVCDAAGVSGLHVLLLLLQGPDGVQRSYDALLVGADRARGGCGGWGWGDFAARKAQRGHSHAAV